MSEQTIRCPQCNGSAWVSPSNVPGLMKSCWRCKGTGRISTTGESEDEKRSQQRAGSALRAEIDRRKEEARLEMKVARGMGKSYALILNHGKRVALVGLEKWLDEKQTLQPAQNAGDQQR